MIYNYILIYIYTLSIYIYIYYIYPPSPAFTKAGAAPGTTAGVEPVFVGLPLPCRSPAPTIPKTPALKPLRCLQAPKNPEHAPRQLRPGTHATAVCC